MTVGETWAERRARVDLSPLPPVPSEASVSGQDGLPDIDRRLICKLDITLDDRPCAAVVSYSVPQGFVRVYAADDPALVPPASRIKGAQTVKVRGVVAVRLKPQWQGLDLAREPEPIAPG